MIREDPEPLVGLDPVCGFLNDVFGVYLRLVAKGCGLVIVDPSDCRKSVKNSGASPGSGDAVKVPYSSSPNTENWKLSISV